ncbi:MAG: hypothetical protein ACLQPD_33435 [Desulfomonilaceae bacterium]
MPSKTILMQSLFKTGKKQASSCLAALVGPDHASENFFEDYDKQAEAMDVLAGGGILAAAKK